MSKQTSKPLTSMSFAVGPWTYTVTITSGPLIHFGQPTLSVVVEYTREIIIAADCPPEHRLPQLLRQLVYAWVIATGQPHRLSEWSDLCGTLLASAMRDLQRQGGEQELMRMMPADPVRSANQSGAA